MKKVLSVYRIPTEDAQDVVQQTMLALVYQWEKVRDPECWVLGTLRRNCLMYWRTQRRRLYQSVDATLLEWLSEPVPPDQERAALFSDLANLMERLPPRCRSLLKLRFGLGYEPPEVAEKMGYRVSSIGKITTRCLAALSREMLAAGITPKALEDVCQTRTTSAGSDSEAPGEPDSASTRR